MKTIRYAFFVIFFYIFLISGLNYAHAQENSNSDKSGINSNDTTIFFEENFDDGNFTDKPEWIPEVQQVCAPELSRILVEDGVLKVYQSGAGRCGTVAKIKKTSLDIPLHDSTKIQFDVKPSFSNVTKGAGYFEREFPIYVTLYLLSANNETYNLSFNYNYRGGKSSYSKDHISIAFPDCRQDAWLRKEVFTVRDYFPDAILITGIHIGGQGWDYEGYADNVIIYDYNTKESGEKVQEDIPDINYTGSEFESVNKHEEAIDLYTENLRISLKMDETRYVALNLFYIGDIYFKLGYYDSAIVYFQQCYEISKKNNHKDKLSKSLKGLAKIYLLWNEFDSALISLNILLDYYTSNSNKNEIGLTLNEMANTYYLSGNSKKAIDYYRESLKLCEETGNTKACAKTLENLGNIFYQDKKHSEALDYYQKSLKINEKNGDLNGAALLLYKIANINLDLKNYNIAIDDLNRSLQISQNQNLISLISNIYLSFSKIYYDKGDNKTALGYYKMFAETKNFLKDKESNKEIAELYVKYETEKKEAEIELLKKDNEIQELNIEQNKKVVRYFILIAGLVLILLLLSYNRYRVNRKANRILAEQKNKLSIALDEREIAQIQLKTLNEELEQKVKEEIKKFSDQKKILVEQSRLADVGLLAAGIAHELNNPLQSMYLSLQNMHESVLDNTADKDYLENKIKYISEDILRIKNIISHVRLFSRGYGTDIKEKFYINESINNALSMFKVQYTNHKIVMNIDLAANIKRIFGNKYKYERIVLNLLFNAKDALDEKAKVLKNDFQKTIRIRSYEENGSAVLAFQDNGIGIPEEDQDKIFTAFFTTKEPEKGTGLGLSISYEIIKEMGGNIEFKSKPMEGTTMIVKAPVVKE
ncbi:MAG: tetratricopeptide repeat protein [Bacteroidales bacterium]|nr:tetratricopeptide repeat protein [Bacteroidales bacterium]